MRNMLIGLVLLGMLGWAVYNVAFEDTPEQNTADHFDVVDESVGSSDESVGSSSEQMAESIEGNPDTRHAEESGEQDGRTLPEVGLNIGQKAPDFELNTLHNETVELSEFQGQKVMLNFWASWCPPCRAEMPDMQRFYEDGDVQILAVNLTQTEERLTDVEQFVEEFELTFPILLDEDIKVATLYQIQPIPTSYLIDSEGYIRHVSIGPMNYEMLVQQFSQMN